MEYTLMAATAFGIESITAGELRELGYEDLKVENGKVTYTGDEMDIAIANVHLRTADRIYIKMAEFKAYTFDELFDKTTAIEWGDLIPIHGKMHITCKSSKSTLYSTPDCQAIVKKAVIGAMKRKYKKDKYPENGPVYKIDVSIQKDVVILRVDTTGSSLHKRGYRTYAGDAPLKETLAATMILISHWTPDKQLADVFCGSGTIPIEAAMIGKNIAPGLNRGFECETWPQFKGGEFNQVREGAKAQINDKEFNILASDVSYRVLKVAMDNAKKAGVDDVISFQKQDMRDFASRKKTGVIISNPPYGERMGDEEEVRALYEDFGELYRKLENWSFDVITSFPDFQDVFGEKATKNRKLYNGNLQCYFYQYIKRLPKREFREDREFKEEK